MGKRRGSGEGSIFQREDGRWVATTSDGWRNGKRKRQHIYGRTRKEVAAKLRARQHEHDLGLPSPSTEQLGAFLDWWIGTLEAKAASGEKSVNTVDNAASAVRNWIAPALGHKRLRDLTPEDVESVLADIVAAGRGRQSVRRVKSYFGQALAVAERRGKVSRNVARIAELPAAPPPRERRSLTADQAKLVLGAARSHRLHALFVCALMLGLRPGELCGLRWQDVDLAEGSLQVAVSLKRERNQLRLGDPKTPRSKRPLNLPRPLLDALKAHRKAQLEERLAAGSEWVDTGFVFTTRVGTAIDPSNLRRNTKEVISQARKAQLAERGLPTKGEASNEADFLVPYVSPNELGRHSAASLLYEYGVPLDRIADMLGHESTRMLEQHYRHRLRASLDVHVGPMEAMFGDV